MLTICPHGSVHVTAAWCKQVHKHRDEPPPKVVEPLRPLEESVVREQCGSWGGVKKHKVNREKQCAECRAVQNAYQRRRYAKKKEGK
jgi:hypothetical protein